MINCSEDIRGALLGTTAKVLSPASNCCRLSEHKWKLINIIIELFARRQIRFMFYFTTDEAEGGGAAPRERGGNDFTLFCYWKRFLRSIAGWVTGMLENACKIDETKMLAKVNKPRDWETPKACFSNLKICIHNLIAWKLHFPYPQPQNLYSPAIISYS